MTRFPCHDVNSAPAGSKETLAGVQKALGFIPSLYGHLAEAPAVLGAMLAVSDHFDRAGLTPREQQAVLLAVSVENGCEFCAAAHSFLGRNVAKIPGAEVDALRRGGSTGDTKLDALVGFAREVVKARGHVVGTESLERLLAAGYSAANALEVVLGVTVKTLSNYASHLTGPELNPQFAAERWTKGAA